MGHNIAGFTTERGLLIDLLLEELEINQNETSLPTFVTLRGCGKQITPHR
jgi:hypothetical protein